MMNKNFAIMNLSLEKSSPIYIISVVGWWGGGISVYKTFGRYTLSEQQQQQQPIYNSGLVVSEKNYRSVLGPIKTTSKLLVQECFQPRMVEVVVARNPL